MKHSLLFLSLPLFLLSSCGPSNGGTDEKFMTKNVETLIDNMNNKDVDAIYEAFSINRKNAIPTLKDDINMVEAVVKHTMKTIKKDLQSTIVSKLNVKIKVILSLLVGGDMILGKKTTSAYGLSKCLNMKKA